VSDRTAAIGRIGRMAGYVAAVLFLGLWLLQYVTAPQGSIEHLAGLDYRNYAAATLDWLDGGTWYLDRQLHGPYVVIPGDVLYPPVWLVLFVPAALAPWPLWWAFPAAMVAWTLWKLRPSPLGLATIAAFVAWPPTAVHLLTGNPGIWLVGSLALAMLYHWPAVVLLTKITVAPLGLWGIRDRRWWVALGVLGLACLLFLPMWPTYVQVLLDAQHPAGALYSAQDLPMLLIPLVAWATSRTRATAIAGG
jgi:hypothetical protein